MAARPSKAMEPLSLTLVGGDAFANGAKLSTLAYAGTKKQWAKVECGFTWHENSSLLTGISCSDGAVTLENQEKQKEGKFRRFCHFSTRVTSVTSPDTHPCYNRAMNLKKSWPFFLALAAVFSVLPPAQNYRAPTLILAEETPLKHHVSFYNYDASLIKTIEVDDGKDAVYDGEEPQKPSDFCSDYSFAGWSVSLSHVTKDLLADALFKENAKSFAVAFYNGTTELAKSSVAYGHAASYSGATPTKADEASHHYHFIGWDTPFAYVTQPLAIHALFDSEVITANCTFQNDDGTILLSEKVPLGEQAIYSGELPQKEDSEQSAFLFQGWDKPLTNIQSDTVFTALYKEEKRHFEVTFINYDGTILDTESVDYGGTAVYQGVAPSKASNVGYTYTFTGWTQPLDHVAGNLRVFPLFDITKRAYTITFKDEDGTILQTGSVLYGDYPAFTGVAPKKVVAGGAYLYTFAGWTTPLVPVTGDAVYTAAYTASIKTYTVVFKNSDGTILETQTVNHGSTAVYSGAVPVNPDSALASTTCFGGWDVKVSNVTSDLVATAVFVTGTSQLTYQLTTYNSYFSYYSVTGYSGTAQYVVVPSTYNGLPVTVIGDNAFKNNSQLLSVFLPEGIQTIGSYAFAGCSALTQINLPSTLSVLAGYAFQNDTALTSMALPLSLFTVNGYIFAGCSSSLVLKAEASSASSSFDTGWNRQSTSSSASYSVTWNSAIATALPNEGSAGENTDYTYWTHVDKSGNKSVEILSYKGSATSLNVPSTIDGNPVTAIGRRAFLNRSGLGSISLPEGLTTIGQQAFRGCSSLSKLNIPSTVSAIGDQAFAMMSYSASFAFLSNVPPQMGGNLFLDAYSYYSETITVPKASLAAYQHISDYFWQKNIASRLSGVATPISTGTTLAGLTYGVYLDSSNQKYVEITGYSGSSSSLVIPKTIADMPVLSIGNSAFKNTNSITSVSLPEGLTSIGDAAFYGCSGFSSLLVPSTVTDVGTRCFANATGLDNGYIKFQSVIPPTFGSDVFAYVWNYSTFIIYVPSAGLSAYKNVTAEYWSSYAVDRIKGY